MREEGWRYSTAARCCHRNANAENQGTHLHERMPSRDNLALRRIATCVIQLRHGAGERRAMQVLPEKRLRCRQAQLPGVDMNGNVVEACIANEAPALFRIMERERSEEHTSELQSLMRTSYAVFCLKKKTMFIECYIVYHPYASTPYTF